MKPVIVLPFRTRIRFYVTVPRSGVSRDDTERDEHVPPGGETARLDRDLAETAGIADQMIRGTAEHR